MRHPNYLPPSAPTMGILLPPEPLQRTCAELGLCQGDGRCSGCEPVEPPTTPGPTWERWANAIGMAAVYGLSTGVALGAIKYLLDLLQP